MRLVTSCTTCRSRKKKCVPVSSGDVCTLCRTKRLSCDLWKIRSQGAGPVESYLVSDRPVSLYSSGSNASPDYGNIAAASRSAVLDILQHVVCDEVVDLYFDMMHNTQQIILHRQSFLDDRKSGLLPDYLVLALVALAARFSSNSYFDGIAPGDRGALYVKQALDDFHVRADAVSVHALQGSILLSGACSVEGRPDQQSLLAAQAVRMVHILNRQQRPDQGRLWQEVDIRLFWQVCMMEAWDAVREDLPRQLTPRSTIPLPLDEDVFESLTTDFAQMQTDATLSETRVLGVWSEIIAVTETYAAVARLIVESVDHPSAAFSVDSKVEALTRQLDHWLDRLPPKLHNTSENFRRSAEHERGRKFAVLHLIYHHQGQLLYFRYLSQCLSEPEGQFDRRPYEYAARCKAHATHLSEIMWRSNTTPGMECLWSPVNGHLLVVASAIHLYTLLCDRDSGRVSAVRLLLERNFVMLVQLQKYWPTLRTALSRLRAFQKACLHHGLAACFEMDAWMVKFLNSYNLEVSDRFPSEDEPDPELSDGLDLDMDTLWSNLAENEEDAHPNDLRFSLSFI